MLQNISNSFKIIDNMRFSKYGIPQTCLILNNNNEFPRSNFQYDFYKGLLPQISLKMVLLIENRPGTN
jgi:hypothetical protein